MVFRKDRGEKDRVLGGAGRQVSKSDRLQTELRSRLTETTVQTVVSGSLSQWRLFFSDVQQRYCVGDLLLCLIQNFQAEPGCQLTQSEA